MQPPLKKVIPSFPATSSKIEVLSNPPPFENLIGGSTYPSSPPPPPPQQKEEGDAHYESRLKMMKNDFTSKALSVLKYLNFRLDFLVM